MCTDRWGPLGGGGGVGWGGGYLWLTPVQFEVLYDERETLDLLNLTLILVEVGQRAFTKQSQPLL